MLSNQQLISNCDNNLGKIEVINSLIKLTYSNIDITKKVIETFIEEQQKTYKATRNENS